MINLNKRTAIAGRNDSHPHLIRRGLIYNLKLHWDGVQPLADVFRMLRDQARRTPLDELTVRIAYHLFTQKPRRELADFQRWTGMLKPRQGATSSGTTGLVKDGFQFLPVRNTCNPLLMRVPATLMRVSSSRRRKGVIKTI